MSVLTTRSAPRRTQSWTNAPFKILFRKQAPRIGFSTNESHLGSDVDVAIFSVSHLRRLSPTAHPARESRIPDPRLRGTHFARSACQCKPHISGAMQRAGRPISFEAANFAVSNSLTYSAIHILWSPKERICTRRKSERCSCMQSVRRSVTG